jgi:two-component system nitrate/nitrite response regulator NarL
MLLIDAQPLFLDAMTETLRRAWPEAAIACAQSYAGGVKHLRTASADIVLANVETLEGAEHAPLERVICAAAPAPVIATANTIDSHRVTRALAAGVRGYLPKTMTGEAICAAVALALGGGVCLAPQALPGAIEHDPFRARQPRSGRELEILTHLARGSPNKMIARELGLSVATVKLHVQSILRRTNARNRTEAIANARRMGILPAS